MEWVATFRWNARSCDATKEHRLLGNKEVGELRRAIGDSVARAEARIVSVGIRPLVIPVEE